VILFYASVSFFVEIKILKTYKADPDDMVSESITNHIINRKRYCNCCNFRACYILQHYKGYNGAYKPFVTFSEFDVTFEGILY